MRVLIFYIVTKKFHLDGYFNHLPIGHLNKLDLMFKYILSVENLESLFNISEDSQILVNTLEFWFQCGLGTDLITKMKDLGVTICDFGNVDIDLYQSISYEFWYKL